MPHSARPRRSFRRRDTIMCINFRTHRSEKRSRTDCRSAMRLSAGSQKDVVKFSMKAQAIRPVPEIGQVKLEMRVLDDAERVLEVVRAACLQLHQNQILSAANPERDVK